MPPRVAALAEQKHVTKYFHKAKEHGVQRQVNGHYCLTCNQGHIATQFNWHGNRAIAKVDILMSVSSKLFVFTRSLYNPPLSCHANITRGVVLVLQSVTSHAAALFWHKQTKLKSSVIPCCQMKLCYCSGTGLTMSHDTRSPTIDCNTNDCITDIYKQIIIHEFVTLDFGSGPEDQHI